VKGISGSAYRLILSVADDGAEIKALTGTLPESGEASGSSKIRVP